jgi:NAD(P)-dependent dehydrogenase (short-subunit alcohol dehydrogenase family)
MPGSRLADKVALITGASSGIGASTARLFGQEGAAVFAVGRNETALQETVRSIGEMGGEIERCRADVADPEDVDRMVSRCMERFGRIDILVNNAATGSTQTTIDTPLELWDRVMDVNARGTFLACKYALPHMIEAGGGVIVNVASVTGLVGLKNRAAYSASKGAVIAFTRALAVDHVKQGIRCNCICPGTVDTPWIERLVDSAEDGEAELASLVARQPMGRLGEPDEIAKAALYLASDDAAFVTGTMLIIDGGITMQ